MATAKKAPAPKKTPVPKKATAKVYPHRKLTVAERAEAAALWRAGTVTLVDLATKFKKRPETFSRLFKNMGIAKGEAAAETAKKLADALAAENVKTVSMEVQRITSMKDEHFRYSSTLAKIAMGEIYRARTASLSIATLRETMLTLKLAGEIVGNSRKELYALLRVEEHDSQAELEDLPELTVAELTPEQIAVMQAADVQEEIGLGNEDEGLDDADPSLGAP